jgi:hypothetical protein
MDVQRPVFFEGQVLAAADLTATVEHERARAARHERMLHDWGIAEGLKLTTANKRDANNNPYVEVTLEPGMATDGTGRDIVVGAAVRLSESVFRQVNGQSLQPDAYYPVVLHGFDDEAPQPAFPAGACGTGGAKRVTEAFEVTFRRIGGAAALDGQTPPDVTSGPGPVGGQPWDVLLGFVQWNGTHFTGVTDSADGVRLRYAGVKADVVAARGGRLELRPDPSREAGKVAVVVGGTPPVLAFGVYRGDGTVEERLTITADGDLHANGDIRADGVVSGSLTAGQTSVQSGVAFDGIVLPLPPGVTQGQVDRGAVVLHIQVTHHVTAAMAPPAGFPLGPLLRECTVDASRTLRCLVRWLNNAGLASDQPGAADYLMLAVGSQSGAGP